MNELYLDRFIGFLSTLPSEGILFFVLRRNFWRGSHPAHDHSALALLLLVVVRFVAHSNLFCLNFSSKFAVDVEAGAGAGQGVILKDPAHVIE